MPPRNKELAKIVEQRRCNIRKFFETHLCATQRECSEALDIPIMAVNRYVREIRSEWQLTKR